MRSRGGNVRIKASRQELLAANVLLEESLARSGLDLPALFGNGLPAEIEIGPGKGAFLLERAAERPELNLLGLEWLRSYAWYAADRARRAGLSNVRLLCADAAAVFRSALPAGSVQRVHVYFPDPWPKRKHRRRRLLTAPFLSEVRRALRLGGWLGVVTDHAEYFRFIRGALTAVPGLAEIPFQSCSAGSLTASNFERKYAAGGRPFFAVAAIRHG